MKKTSEIEIEGVGKIKLYSIKVEKQIFEECNKNGEKLKKVLVEKPKRAVYKWVDSKGNEYTEKDVFRNIGGILVQKVKKTEVVRNYKIVDKNNIDLVNSSYMIAVADKYTEERLKQKIGNDKAIMFIAKFSTNGFKWQRAYLFYRDNVLLLVKGEGLLSKAIEEFYKQIQAKKQYDDFKQKLEQVVVKAEEIKLEV